MRPTPEHHHHRDVYSSPQDRAFVRSFVGVFAGTIAALALLVWLTDPLATFGTNLVPPVVSADRDYKAALYRARSPEPEIVLLGSSRVKTLRPGCITALTSRPAFNFGVNAGTAEDFLAIFRFMRAQPGFRVREIVLGAEPEAFVGEVGTNRALSESRVLAPFASFPTLGVRWNWADLLGEQAVTAAFRSVGHFAFHPDALPQEALAADGFQTHPRWDAELRLGVFPQQTRVAVSSRDVRSRYAGGISLSSSRLRELDRLLGEAKDARVRVTVFVPPVHPLLLHEAMGTALPSLTAQLVGVLRGAERKGLVRYAETRSLADFAGDPALYYDAIHMTAANADRLLAALYRKPTGCALQ